MKKLYLAAIASGLLSGAALAEPLSLDDATLQDVNGGFLRYTDFDLTKEVLNADVGFLLGIDLGQGPTNSSSIHASSKVVKLGDADVSVTQGADVSQMSSMDIGPID